MSNDRLICPPQVRLNLDVSSDGNEEINGHDCNRDTSASKFYETLAIKAYLSSIVGYQ